VRCTATVCARWFTTWPATGKAKILGTAGAVKLVQDPSGRVAGVHMVGERVSELVGEAQMLYGLGASVADAARLVHAHPTQG